MSPENVPRSSCQSDKKTLHTNCDGSDQQEGREGKCNNSSQTHSEPLLSDRSFNSCFTNMMKQRSLLVLVLLVWCASQATAFSPLSRRPRTRTARARVASPSLAAALHPSSASSSTPFVLWDDQATTTTTTTTVPGIDDSLSYLLQTASNAYVQFAKENPFLNNMAIACTKTAAADILAQTVIGGTPLMDLDLQRTLLFFMFGFHVLTLSLPAPRTFPHRFQLERIVLLPE